MLLDCEGVEFAISGVDEKLLPDLREARQGEEQLGDVITIIAALKYFVVYVSGIGKEWHTARVNKRYRLLIFRVQTAEDVVDVEVAMYFAEDRRRNLGMIFQLLHDRIESIKLFIIQHDSFLLQDLEKCLVLPILSRHLIRSKCAFWMKEGSAVSCPSVQTEVAC